MLSPLVGIQQDSGTLKEHQFKLNVGIHTITTGANVFKVAKLRIGIKNVVEEMLWFGVVIIMVIAHGLASG